MASQSRTTKNGCTVSQVDKEQPCEHGIETSTSVITWASPRGDRGIELRYEISENFGLGDRCETRTVCVKFGGEAFSATRRTSTRSKKGPPGYTRSTERIGEPFETVKKAADALANAGEQLSNYEQLLEILIPDEDDEDDREQWASFFADEAECPEMKMAKKKVDVKGVGDDQFA